MVKLLINKKKIMLGGLLLLVIVSGIVAFIVLTSSKDSQQETAKQDTSKNTDVASKDVPPAIDSIEPPQTSAPAICNDINNNVIAGAVGSGFSMSGGREAETDNDSSFRECNYSKDDERVSVRVYEYENQATARADVSEQRLTGYAVRSQGKYVVSVSVMEGNTPNTVAADNLLSAVLEEL